MEEYLYIPRKERQNFHCSQRTNRTIILKQNFFLLDFNQPLFLLSKIQHPESARDRDRFWVVHRREEAERGSTPIGIGDAGRLIIFHGRLRGSVTTSRRLPTGRRSITFSREFRARPRRTVQLMLPPLERVDDNAPSSSFNQISHYPRACDYPNEEKRLAISMRGSAFSIFQE